MKIAIYTLTRERLDYTKHCFGLLYKKANGYPFDHFILDNGSEDGTAAWLKEHPESVNGGCRFIPFLLPENIGISRGSNFLLDKIFATGDYDLIIKMDNDCEIVTDDILRKIADISSEYNKGGLFVLSPRVEGLNRQPRRGYTFFWEDNEIGVTGIVGGLFHIVPSAIYRQYRYPVDFPKAWGQDDHFCAWLNREGYKCGYIENLLVNHYETTNGQAARYPDYFRRKWQEEKN